MKVDFDLIEEKSLPNFKGGDLHYDASIFDDGNNKIMRGKLVPGASIGMHQHTDSSEIIFVVDGIGTVYSPHGSKETILPGQCTYCRKGESHSLRNEGTVDLRFFAVVPQQ